MLVRFVVLAVIVAVLAATGLIDFGTLPWGNDDFRASGAVVLLYLAWSMAEKRPGTDGLDPSRLALYTVLLVSAVDSFLLRLTAWNGHFALRYAGAVLFAVGCALRLGAGPRRNLRLLRTGRILQLVGLPAGLGSAAGVVTGALPGVIAASRETFPPEEVEE